MEKKRFKRFAIIVSALFICTILFIETSKCKNPMDNVVKYLANKRDALAPKTCSANLTMIEIEKEVWAIDTEASKNATPIFADLAPLKEPHCPGDGVYAIGDLKTPPMCSVHGNKKNIEKSLGK